VNLIKDKADRKFVNHDRNRESGHQPANWLIGIEHVVCAVPCSTREPMGRNGTVAKNLERQMTSEARQSWR
jgi:hypothetical protein